MDQQSISMILFWFYLDLRGCPLEAIITLYNVFDVLVDEIHTYNCVRKCDFSCEFDRLMRIYDDFRR